MLGYDDEVSRLAGVVCAGCKQSFDPSDELWEEIEEAYSARD
jgi:hypothetical protein